MRNIFALLRAQPVRWIGVAIVLILALIAAFAPVITSENPEAANPANVLVHPGDRAFFGTDSSGMDIFARIVFGARIDLGIAAGITAIAVAIGIPLGVLSGYLRG